MSKQRKQKRALSVIGVAFLSVAMASAQTVNPHGNGNGSQNGDSGDLQPDGKGSVTRAKVRGNGIFYHGGPLLLGTPNIYYVWYGNWGGNSAPTILEDFARHIGPSPYYNINTTYYNGSNTH